jgi:hypothetical protein
MNDRAGAFARYVVGWFACELDLAVAEVQAVAPPSGLRASLAMADLLEVQRAVLAVERALTGKEAGTESGEALAEHFCVQLVFGFCALLEWRYLRGAGECDRGGEMGDGEGSNYEARVELARQILIAFRELKKGVEHLQRTVDEIAVGMPELGTSLEEMEKTIGLLREHWSERTRH